MANKQTDVQSEKKPPVKASNATHDLKPGQDYIKGPNTPPQTENAAASRDKSIAFEENEATPSRNDH